MNRIIITGPIIPDLLDAGQIEAVDEGLGPDTAPDRSIFAGSEYREDLALAGQLALGSVTGTEAIHYCCTGDLDLWAAAMKS